MMSWLQVIALALVQGVTEFLPISSSAHLILSSQLLNWPDQGIAFDVAVHLGTLLAVMFYFRVHLKQLLVSWFCSLSKRQLNAEAKLAWGIIVATIPVCLVGFFAHDTISENLRTPQVIAIATIVFGLLLGLVDRIAINQKSQQTLSLATMIVIGLAQVLALIPGTSRSGITMTAGLWRGLSRHQASQFSFLLSIPVIALAALYESYQLITSTLTIPWLQFATAITVSALSAYACIALFLKLIERIGFLPFILYRLILGAWLLTL